MDLIRVEEWWMGRVPWKIRESRESFLVRVRYHLLRGGDVLLDYPSLNAYRRNDRA